MYVIVDWCNVKPDGHGFDILWSICLGFESTSQSEGQLITFKMISMSNFHTRVRSRFATIIERSMDGSWPCWLLSLLRWLVIQLFCFFVLSWFLESVKSSQVVGSSLAMQVFGLVDMCFCLSISRDYFLIWKLPVRPDIPLKHGIKILKKMSIFLT